MKLKTVLSTALMATVFSLISPATSQAQAVGDDGITASPKVRMMLNERKAKAPAQAPAKTAVVSKHTVTTAPVSIAASPKVQQLLRERALAGTVPPEGPTLASATAPAPDGIVASPKVRAQLNERYQTFQIAPVK